MRQVQWRLGARLMVAALAAAAGMAGTAEAQARRPVQGLADLNVAMESLVERVSQSVVQVVVTS